MSSRRRLATSLDRSHVGTTLRDAIDTSTAVRVGRRIATPIRVTYRDSGGVDRWRRTAVTLAVVRAIQATIATATKTAVITCAGRTVAAWTRASFLYRWLTKEPEPEMIVIDLRETVTVGPIIALLDALVDAFAPSVRRSSLVDTLVETGQAIEAAPIRALSLVVLVATVVNLLVTLALAGFDPAGVALRILVIGAAAVGTRVTLSWAELRHSRAGRAVAGLLEPPESVEDDEDDLRSDRT